jgi:hypothetical protein
LPESALETTGGAQTFRLYEKSCGPPQEITVLPLLVVSFTQVSLELSDSKVAPSGMERAVYGFFSTQTLFVSLTTGVGIATPAVQAGAKGKADAAGSVTGEDNIMGTRAGSICCGVNN